MNTFEVTRAAFVAEHDRYVKLLRDGWEPFGIEDAGRSTIVWFKRGTAHDSLGALNEALDAACRNYTCDTPYTDFTARLHFHDEIEDLKDSIQNLEARK